jgi:hypothetical protein
MQFASYVLTWGLGCQVASNYKVVFNIFLLFISNVIVMIFLSKLVGSLKKCLDGIITINVKSLVGWLPLMLPLKNEQENIIVYAW